MNAMIKRARRKRGIILMVVISLLTLFILLGVTYTLVATQYRESAGNVATLDRYGDSPVTEANLILDQILFDSTMRTSLQGHSLLADLYGNDSVGGRVESVLTNYPPGYSSMTTPKANTHFLFLSITDSTVLGFDRTLSQVPDYYTGRVLTFLTGNYAGASGRIAGYVPASGMTQAAIAVEKAEFSGNPSANDIFLINGAPFNGPGAGFDASLNPMNVTVGMANYPMALLPHFSAHASPPNFNAGGVDESWDAVDYNNMFLAMVPPDTSTHPIIPSFHRPELIQYWASAGAANWDPATAGAWPNDYRAFRRMSILRPMPWDHPDFTGSNPAFAVTGWDNGPDMADNDGATDSDDFPSNDDALMAALQNGPWDVDNDNDGIPDSIWIDPGLPILTAPDGRRYKRLAAILIKDLDGRINVNAHGNSVLASNANSRPDSAISPPGTSRFAGYDVSSTASITLPRGLGYGPAEVNLYTLLTGDAASFIESRYGGASAPPGATGNDTFSSYKTQGMIDSHTAAYSAYSSPADVWGRGAVALDLYGQPIWMNIGTGETNDDPYEMQVDARTASDDAPFNVSELERLLRFNDADAKMINSRLATTATISNPRLREMLTTASWHIPMPKGQVPIEQRWSTATGNAWADSPASASILDLYRKKIDANYTDDIWKNIVPWELRHGEPFNINRYLGDGSDNATTNDVVDEPGETESSGYFTNDQADTSYWASRQAFARHLYCLALLLKNPNYEYDIDGDGTATPEETARLIAQWAINVVDFRDSDSINTPFEYDLNPWDGWHADGDPTESDYTVWGVERPELLITEAIAWHDRRTEDLDNDGGVEKKTTEAMDPDPNFDQRLRPSGAAFIELYNPWFDSTSPTGQGQHKKPMELYGPDGGVRLNARTPGNYPVWRIIVVQKDGKTKNPDEPRPESLTGPANGQGEIERSIYFTPLGGAGGAVTPTNCGQAYWTNDNNISELLPGRYAVIGSSGINGKSYIGRLNDMVDEASLNLAGTRQIALTPSADENNNEQVQILNNGSDNNPDNNEDDNLQNATASKIQPPIAVAISQPRSFSVSEPVSGYAATVSNGADGTDSEWTPGGDIPDSPDGGSYQPPIDKPLDLERAENDADLAILNKDGSEGNFRVIHLQRLANPLADWNPNTNPYITVDSSSIDLTCFNGVTNEEDPALADSQHTNFQTFQRGGSFNVMGAGQGWESHTDTHFRNLWLHEPPRSAVPDQASATEDGGIGPHFFNFQLFHTLGFLNKRYQPRVTTAGTYLGAPSGTGTDGSAVDPFPWLTFNNRPFANPMELLLVPCRSQRDLLVYYRLGAVAGVNEYDNTSLFEPNGYLLNFFQGPVSDTSSSGTDLGPQWNRIFDYIETPSPFVRTEQWYTLTDFDTTASPAGSIADSYRPPFTRLSRQRDPGRINLNTIFDRDVFRAALAGIPQGTVDALWDDLVRSRRGYDASSAYQTDAAYPSRFSNPFRSADAADLMPITTMEKKSIDATLLRKHPTLNDPLFSDTSSTRNKYNDPDRNPYFRFQELQKAGNIFTTNSNVFAVWITVGYFEVAPAPLDIGHPDGVQLGMELGADTGQVKRHRSFFIIDRSIPVAYQPGQRHNTEKAVLLRRYIE